MGGNPHLTGSLKKSKMPLITQLLTSSLSALAMVLQTPLSPCRAPPALLGTWRYLL